MRIRENYLRWALVSIILVGALIVPSACGADDNDSSIGNEPKVALKKQLVTDGLIRPLFATFAPGDSTRIFVVEKQGKIRIVRAGSLLPQPFLDVSDSVGIAGSGERGLLGMAFHPDYQSNGYFYVNYTAGASDGATHVSRFSVTADPDSADRGSEMVLLDIDQPFSNHNAGMLAFGPEDGYLYVGTGDGGSANDPGNRAQNPQKWLGKMLRIDVDGGTPYAIPPDNPFVDSSEYLPEIWALGLRNPWRYAFDEVTGDLFIADVGQNEIEEIDFQPAASSGGENYGWRLKEGRSCFIPPDGCDTLTELTDPIFQYLHNEPPSGCSITGGFVYRGCAMPDLHGLYFFGDYCTGDVWALRYDPGQGVTSLINYSGSLSPGPGQLVSFGIDYHGELYITAIGSGRLYKIVPDGVPSQCGLDCCNGVRGNIDADSLDQTSIADLTFLIDYMFRDGESPSCMFEADVNASFEPFLDINDLTYMVGFVFQSGPPPLDCWPFRSPRLPSGAFEGPR